MEGTVVFKVGQIGKTLIFLRTKFGMILLAGIAIIVYNHHRLTNQKKKDRKTKRKIHDLNKQKQELEKSKI